jgi:membrane carboxypeptidase/penicillin-binding protein
MANVKTERTSRRSRQTFPAPENFLYRFFAILVVTVGGTAAYYLITLDLPGIDALKDYRPSIASRVLDENDELIDEFLPGRPEDD